MVKSLTIKSQQLIHLKDLLLTDQGLSVVLLLEGTQVLREYPPV